MDEYEELTEEELKRRREAARRRKMAARERRRKKRRQEAIIRCSILLIIVILLIVGIVKGISGIWKHFHEKKKDNDKVSEQIMEPTTEVPTTEEFKVDSSILAMDMPADREAALTILKERAESEEDSELQNICDNAAVYSDRVLMNLAANPDLKQFTIDYLTKVTVAFDGEFTMDVSTDEVPLLLQYDEQWGYADYGDNLLAYNGAAPTCLAMATSYLKKDPGYNPIKIGDFAMANGYLDENDKTSWDLMTKGTSELGLSCNELSINEGNMKANLDEGKVIICCVQAGDFTKDEHYIVIRGYDDYKFLVNDPASQARSEIAWPFERLSSQIKNMWAIGIDSSATPEDSNNTTNDTGDSSTDGDNTDTTIPASTGADDTTSGNTPANTDGE
ncbi:MAG: C39 family peptidase [Lachnospiraceae bacterium]|nr:C39 family peptidase [Lachnospiraceae bacterium]